MWAQHLDAGIAPVALVVLAALTIAYYFMSGKRKVPSPDEGGGGAHGTPIRHGSSQRIMQAQSRSSIDIEKIAAECREKGDMWKDPDFGHDGFPGASIGDLELKDGERGKPLAIGKEGVTWQPPPKFCATPRPMGVRGDGIGTWLYSDSDGDGVVSAAESMKPTDVVQGSVGDCYFLSALAAVVFHHPDLADDLIDETYEEQGIYGVSFWRDGRWRMTWVDQYFPCYRPSGKSHSGKHKLIFASGEDHKETWPMVVEKAFAKEAGSYEAIAGGQVSAALEMLTGGKGQARNASLDTTGAKWEQFKREVLSDEYFVGAGSKQLSTDTEEAAQQKKVLQGIITGHAYTVLTVYEAGELRLVELRNPWGRGEWTGDWGTGSCQWDREEGKAAQAVVGSPPSQDGRFWMAWEDFTKCFDTIDTCHMNFSDDDRARRKELAAQAAVTLAKHERPKQKHGGGSDGGGSDDGPVRTQESADAMMAMLLAEDAKEKRMKNIGARGNKRKTPLKKGKKQK